MNFEIMLSFLLEHCSGSAVKSPSLLAPWIYIFLHKTVVTEISPALVQMLDVFDALTLTHSNKAHKATHSSAPSSRL